MKSTEHRLFLDASRLSVFLATAVLLAAAFLAACSSASTSVVAPTAQKCQVSVSDFTRTFGASGGSGTATITAERECSWTAATQTPWITVGTAGGTGNGSVNFTVAPNQVPQGRSGALAVNTEQLTVSQEPAPCRFTVSPSELRVDPAGGTFSIEVSTASGCSWGASTGASWMRAVASAGNGTGTVTLTVTPNTGAERGDVVTVASQPVTVIQGAVAPAPIPVPPTPGCSFALRPPALSFAPEGGQATVQVETTGRCDWTASTTSAWLAPAPASGTGPTNVTVTAGANTTAAARTGTITIGGQTIVATQDAPAPAPTPTPVTVSGDVSRKNGECPSISFRVNDSVNVVTNADTVFVGGCDKVKNGATVTVDGLQQPGQPVVATRVVVAAR